MKMSEKLARFLKLTNQFKSVTRCQFVPGEPTGRFENDAEHSYEVAMCAWYLNHELDLGYSDEILLKYSLVHDLVEVYTGDEDSYLASVKTNGCKDKARREKQAMVDFKADLDFPELHNLIHNYESKASEEAIFVWTLDKIIANINSDLDGKKLRDCGYTKEMHHNVIDNKIKKHKVIADIYKEFVDQWETDTNYYADTSFEPEYKSQRPKRSSLWR